MPQLRRVSAGALAATAAPSARPYRSVQMRAVETARQDIARESESETAKAAIPAPEDELPDALSFHDLDEELFFDADEPKGGGATTTPTPAQPVAAAAASAIVPVTLHAAEKPPIAVANAAIAAFAGYGSPPSTLWDMPRYALHAYARTNLLRRELGDARAGRSPDVGLYEAALRMSDRKAIRLGISIIVLAVTAPFGLLMALATLATAAH